MKTIYLPGVLSKMNELQIKILFIWELFLKRISVKWNEFFFNFKSSEFVPIIHLDVERGWNILSSY